MKKKLRKYQFGSQGLASTPTNPYTGFSPSISLQGPSSGLGMSKPLDYENDKPKTQLAPSSSLLNKPSLSPAPTSTPYTGISSKPIVSPAFTSTPSIASPQRYASASVKPEAGAPKTAFGATKTGLNQTKLQSATLTAPPPKTNVGSTAAAGVTAGLNMIGQGVETYRGYNPVAPGPTSLYNKREQGMLKKINKERDAVTALSTTAGALGTAAGITAAIPVIGWGVGAGLGIAAAGTGVAAASTAASLDKQETNLGKRVNSRIEREKREAEGLRKTQEIESMMNSSNPLDIQNEMMSIEGGTSEETRPGFNAENFQKAIEGAVGFDREEVPLEYKYGGKMPKKQLGTYSKPSYALQYDTIPYVGTMKGPQLYNDPFADKKRYPVPNDVKFDTRDTLLGMRDRGMPLPKNAEYELGEELDPNFVGPSGRIPTTVDPKKMKAPNKYKMGGLRSYQEPNAELERGEVTQHPNGKVEIEGGKRHEEGGNEKYVPPGAFIWSDHLKYQGKSMAQWFLMFKDNPERVEQLKALQENLASKEKPSKYNDLPQKKYGGGEVLPKYQIGSPNPSIVDYLNSKGIDSSFKNRKTLSGVSNYRGTAEQNQKLLKEYVDAEAALNNSNTLAKNPPTTVYGPAQGALKRQEEDDVPDETVYTSLPEKAGRAPGTYSKARTVLNEYGRYIPQLAGSLAQIGMLAGMSDPYEDLTVPKASLVGNHRFTPFGRLNNQAAEDQIREMYHAQLTDARYRGAGPGDSSQGQKAYNQAIQGIAETQKGVMGANVSLAAQEANMNMEDKQRRDITNAAAINARNESINANRVASANFGVQKSGALAGAFGTIGTDISKSIADREQALAIYGDTTMNADRYGINNKEVDRLAKEAAAKKAKALGREATPQEELIEKVNIYNAMRPQIG